MSSIHFLSPQLPRVHGHPSVCYTDLVNKDQSCFGCSRGSCFSSWCRIKGTGRGYVGFHVGFAENYRLYSRLQPRPQFKIPPKLQKRWLNLGWWSSFASSMLKLTESLSVRVEPSKATSSINLIYIHTDFLKPLFKCANQRLHNNQNKEITSFSQEPSSPLFLSTSR